MKEPKWNFKYVSEKGTLKFECEHKSDMAQYICDLGEKNNGAKVEISAISWSGRDIKLESEDAKTFFSRYKLHHPMPKHPDPLLQQRVKRVRVTANGHELTAKELWETHYRGQIDDLVRGGSDNYVAALSLMIPCMDRVYTLLHPECDRDEEDRPDTSYGSKVFELFFPAGGFDESTYEYLNRNLRNGVIHYAFLRGDIGIDNTIADTEYYGDAVNVFHQLRSSDGRILLLIKVPYCWERVKVRIDRFYEHAQWITGWSMHKMIRIEPYSGLE